MKKRTNISVANADTKLDINLIWTNMSKSMRENL